MKHDDEGISIGEAICVRETEKSIFVQMDPGKRSEHHWIPQSQVHDDSDVWKVGQRGQLIIKRWWAEEKGFV